MDTLTCTHNICFEQKYENSQKFSTENCQTENCHFYSREKLLYIVWACFRNVWGYLSAACIPNSQTIVPGSQVIKHFFMLNSAEHEIYPAHKC